MIKGRFGDNNMLIGLSRKNLELLQEGKPIDFDMAEVGLAPGKIVIFFGETEESMMQGMSKTGMLLMDVTKPEGAAS